ncbi:MAG: ABC transporter ATP-binding protein [Elusimicrobia bacterium]|nr:ABC transporter ATP-binding protein [Elusimicrobiota bacterium]
MNLSRQIWKHLLPGQRRRFALVLGVGLAGGLMELIGVGSVMPFLALLSRPELIHTQPVIHKAFLWGGFADDRAFLMFCGTAAIFFLISANAFVFLKTALIVSFSTRQMPKIAARVLRAFLAKDYPFFLASHSGQLAKDVLMLSDSVANAVLQSWLTAFSESTTILLLTALILWADPLIGVTVLVSMGTIVAGSYYLIRRRIAHFGELTDETNGRRFERCLEILGAAKEIKAAEAEAYFARSFEPYADKHAEAYRLSSIFQTLPSSFVQAVAASFILAIALWQLSRGSDPAQVVALLSLYAVAGYRLLPSLLKFSGAASQLQHHRFIFDKLITLLSATPPAAPDTPPLPLEREVRLDTIIFRYPGQTSPVFDGLDLTIRCREFLALAGGSGAGKSTLADLLLGLQRPQSGHLSVDGAVLDDKALARWRRSVAFVPQSVFLFDSTIAENIAFGIEPGSIDRDRVRKAAELAQIADFVDGLPEGYETRIGERGGRLSGGQRQRLGIARAMYREPSVLILDEPTSALDGITETELARALEGLKGRLTLVVIAHRPSTVKLGDRVIVLENGQISCSGRYDDLLLRNPHFARLMSEPEDRDTSGGTSQVPAGLGGRPE